MRTYYTFNLYENVRASFEIINGEVRYVKILSKVPKGQINSFLNDAGLEAEKMCQFIKDVVAFAHKGDAKIIETNDFVDGVVYAYRLIHDL